MNYTKYVDVNKLKMETLAINNEPSLHQQRDLHDEPFPINQEHINNQRKRRSIARIYYSIDLESWRRIDKQ